MQKSQLLLYEILDTLSFIKGVTSQRYEHLYPCLEDADPGECQNYDLELKIDEQLPLTDFPW